MKIPALLAALTIVSLVGACFAADDVKPTGGGTGGKLFHVVSIKFKEGAKEEQIKDVERAFVDLKTKIPTITSLHWGTNVSPEKRNKGYTHCFVLTFASDKDRDAYLVDPAHKAFGKVLGPVLDDVMVIDFWSHE